MKIETIEEALKLFEDVAIKYSEAIDMGKSKIANRNYDKMAEIAKFLREKKSLHELDVFYQHSNIGLRTSAATYLLPVYEKKSLAVLKEVAKMEGLCAFDAELTIQEWKNGHLRNYYTL